MRTIFAQRDIGMAAKDSQHSIKNFSASFERIQKADLTES